MCDVSGSTVSSNVSSRAPSPSPSLRSIVFPGLRHTVSSHPGTPTNTPSIGRTAVNLFQPIHTSASSASLSALTAPSPLLAAPVPDGQPRRLTVSPAIPEVQVAVQDASSQTDENSGVVAALSLVREPTLTLETDDTTERMQSPDPVPCQMQGTITEGDRPHSVGSKAPDQPSAGVENMHHRTRSNEIDYSMSSTRNGVGPSITAFRSPPGTVRGFRPVTIDTKQDLLCTPFTIPTGAQTAGHSEDSVSTGSRVSPPPGQASPTDKHAALAWTKDLDASIFDYFDSNDSHIQVTDC